MRLTIFLLAALLATAAAQTPSLVPTQSPTISRSPTPSATGGAGSPFTGCSTLLLAGTGNYDIVLLGAAAASPSGSPSVSAQPSGSAVPSGSLQPSGSVVPSGSLQPSGSAVPSGSLQPSAAASPSVAISPSANIRLLDITNSLVGGRIAVNGNARVNNALIGTNLGCRASVSPSASAAQSAAISSAASPATSAATSPATSSAASPAISAATSPTTSAAASPATSASASPSPQGAGAADLSLVVSGNLEINNVQLACGGLAVGGQVTGQPSLGQQGASNLSGNQALATIQTLNLSALRTRLLATSTELCNLNSTGRLSVNQFGAAVLDASAQSNATSGTAGSNVTSGQNNVTIFNLPSSALANLTSVLINGTSQNSFVIINVIDQPSTSGGVGGGSSVTSGTGLNASTAGITLTRFNTNIGSLNSSHLLWNFCNATSINIDSILVVGTILAPRASVNITGAEIEGGLFAQSLTGDFFNQVPSKFQGVFCSQTSANRTVSGSSTASS